MCTNVNILVDSKVVEELVVLVLQLDPLDRVVHNNQVLP